MALPTLIYCAGGNKLFADIAISYGFKYGACLPDTIYHPIYFADQNWKKPNKEKYLEYVSMYRPYLASVLDWEEWEQLDEVLEWAEAISSVVTEIVLIPKVQGGITVLPKELKGKKIRLGFSIPNRPRPGEDKNKWGENQIQPEDFAGWPVHLLGGSPGKQRKYSQFMNVQSVDCNMHHMMATTRCLFWMRGKKIFSNKWLSLKQADGRKWEGDLAAPYEAFRRSCRNIKTYWELTLF